MCAVPAHIGIIMDGNSRWALMRSLPKIEGYKKGARVAMDVVLLCISYGIRYLTLYAFSTENWRRNEEDVEDLFSLFIRCFDEYSEQLFVHRISVRFIGEIFSLPEKMQDIIKILECREIDDVQCSVNIAMGYGSRQEILSVVKKLIILKKSVDDVNLELFNSLLYTSGTPDPDFIIRTGGEKRLSNFLLWQSAYSELSFCDVMWPDFNVENFVQELEIYKARVRRYGR